MDRGRCGRLDRERRLRGQPHALAPHQSRERARGARGETTTTQKPRSKLVPFFLAAGGGGPLFFQNLFLVFFFKARRGVGERGGIKTDPASIKSAAQKAHYSSVFPDVFSAPPLRGPRPPTFQKVKLAQLWIISKSRRT